MTITKEDLLSISPDELTPAATEAKVEKVAETKAAMPAARCFVSAMLAGAFIGFGAMYFCTFLGDPTLPFGVQRTVGGLCFCLGLVLVLCCGAELFTGNILMVCARASKKISGAALARSWALVWLGNLAGSLVAVTLVFFANVQGMNAFVACGFEHCVANMFFLPMGFALNGAGFGAAGAITVGGMVYNIALATVGNIVGGAIVGAAYWFVYRRK